MEYVRRVVGTLIPQSNTVTFRLIASLADLFTQSLKMNNIAVWLGCCILSLTTHAAVPQRGKDVCHVFVVDVAKSARAFEKASGTNQPDAEKALSAGQTVFPEFRPTIGEEELTTKHYSFPGGRLIITASVFYTDESMSSHGHGEFASHSESMIVGVTVSTRAKRNAVAPAGNPAIAEVTYDENTNKVRAEKYFRARGQLYLVGIECDCMADKRSK